MRRCWETAGRLIENSAARARTGRGPALSVSSRARRTGPAMAAKTSTSASWSGANRRLLEDDAVPVGVVEGDEPAPRLLLDAALDGHAAGGEGGDVAVQVVGLEHHALDRARRHRREPGHERDRRLRALGRDLDPALVRAHRVVADEAEAEHAHVELAGPVLVGDGERDELQVSDSHAAIIGKQSLTGWRTLTVDGRALSL